MIYRFKKNCKKYSRNIENRELHHNNDKKIAKSYCLMSYIDNFVAVINIKDPIDPDAYCGAPSFVVYIPILSIARLVA